MISLLANFQIRKYDILTIQKLWRNVCVSTSYNSFLIDFHLLYEMKENVRECFYVNTKLNVNNWSTDFVSSNMCTLKFDLNDQRIVNIHDVYNVFSMFYASDTLLLIIETTQNRFVIDEEHVFLKDFNLHHSLWSDSIRSTQHTAIDQLIDLLVNKHMNFCLSQKIVTWKTKNSRNIINLIFMIERLQASITHCECRRDLNQSSNHISIFTILTLKIEQTSVKERKAWKKIDNERLTFCLRLFVVSASFNNVNDIETFVKKIQLSVQSIIQEAILMIRKSERAQFFWSFKCSEIVTTIKRRRRKWSTRRIEKNWKTYLKFIDVHSLCFREANIIILKKSNKNDYTDFKTYRFIALLNTIDKAFEFIIANKISTFAEIHEMLFATQMKKRREKVYETTLKLFIEQIHTIWNMSKNKMITLLSMNVANAYDHVSRKQLMHNLRKRKISN
jgi:hypothetical protein